MSAAWPRMGVGGGSVMSAQCFLALYLRRKNDGVEKPEGSR